MYFTVGCVSVLPAPVDHPVRVLIVGTHPRLCPIVASFLRHEPDFEVIGALSADDALPLEADLPDAVVVDCSASLTPLATLAQVRQAYPSAAIVAFSLYAASSYRQAALVVGADELLEKADLATRLAPAIRRLARP